jgi:hypothetical protein
MKAKNDVELKKILPAIVRVLRKYGVKRAGVFGSYVRGEQNKGSDIDIVIEPSKGLGLFNFIGIKLDLEEELGMKVDLLTYKSIHPYLRKQIMSEEIKVI